MSRNKSVSGTGIQRVSINDTGDRSEHDEEYCCEYSVLGDVTSSREFLILGIPDTIGSTQALDGF
jgi:hypothetical protein